MASEPWTVRMRLIRRKRRSRATPAASAWPMASPICTTRDRTAGVIVYGGLRGDMRSVAVRRRRVVMNQVRRGGTRP